jgi:hypothetical protein
VESTAGDRPRHAVVAHDPRRAARRNAVARRLLPRLPDEPGDRSPRAGSPPTGVSRITGARSAVLVVSGVGADAEAAGAVCPAAGKVQRDRTLRMEPSVVGAPRIAEIETLVRRCAPKKPGNGDFWTASFTGGKITMLIIVLLGLATASGAAMIVSVKEEPVLLACGGANC